MNTMESMGEGAGVKLSRRLTALADWVPNGARFADIGTDHALLPVYLAASGRVPMAVAGDVNAGPVEAARRQVAEAGLQQVVSVRHGDGLSVLAPGEVDAVCIAGMGGGLMVRLLEEAGERLQGVRTLILSPHVAEESVRTWLRDRGFAIDRESLLEEDGVIYTLIRATGALGGTPESQAANQRLYDVDLLPPHLATVRPTLLLEMGPLLARHGGSLFRRKWELEIAKREKIRSQMLRSASPEAQVKAAEWESQIAEIREVLACLPVEKPSSN